MAYSVVPTVATGDLWTAANHNTYIRDNFAAGVPGLFTSAGDMAYASGLRAATRLPVGSAGKILRVLATGLPGWGGPVITRIGGSTTDWSVVGSTVYTPDQILIQMGIIGLTLTANGSVASGFSFSTAFAGVPMAFASPIHQYEWYAISVSPTATMLNYVVKNLSNVATTMKVNWMAIGQPAS